MAASGSADLAPTQPKQAGPYLGPNSWQGSGWDCGWQDSGWQSSSWSWSGWQSSGSGWSGCDSGAAPHGRLKKIECVHGGLIYGSCAFKNQGTMMCKPSKPCSKAPPGHYLEKDVVVDLIHKYFVSQYSNSPSGKFTTQEYLDKYNVYRQQHPLPEPYEGEFAPPQTFNAGTRQPIIMFPMSIEDKAGQWWPNHGHLDELIWAPQYTDPWGCQYRNLYVYRGN
jgi:hypothetical protein